MSGEIVIPCELTITPGGGYGRQNKLRLSASGETVFDAFEDTLSPEERRVAAQIVEAHARLLSKWASGTNP